uniref:Uncharacterized protein n=1 Tax=Rhizophora mucronata TaxID=61149 RepID=A0A2P2QX53_RHIMU
MYPKSTQRYYQSITLFKANRI